MAATGVESPNRRRGSVILSPKPWLSERKNALIARNLHIIPPRYDALGSGQVPRFPAFGDDQIQRRGLCQKSTSIHRDPDFKKILQPRRSDHSANAIAEFLQFGFDAVGVVALDFDVVAVDGSTGAAGVFQFLKNGDQIILARNEVANNGHHATVFSLLYTDSKRLLLRSLLHRLRRRTFAIGLRQITTFAMCRSIPLSTSEQAHV